MSAYYYLVAGLPDISLEDGKLSYTISDFRADAYEHLSAKDQALIDLFYLNYDHADLLSLLKDKDAVTLGRGNFSSEDLLQLIASVKDGEKPDAKFPSYLYDFIAQYLALPTDELYKAENMLASAYYAYAMKSKNQFVTSWFEFNLNINNILAAFAARKYKMNVPEVIVGNTEICEMLRTSNARDFGLGETLDYFEPLQRLVETDDLVEREKKIDQLKWKWLEEASFFHYFTIERLFVFLLQLEMIERWVLLDKEKGSELFRQMIQNLKNEVQIPEEFRK